MGFLLGHTETTCLQKSSASDSYYLTQHLFIYLWLHGVFVAACRLSLVAVSRDYASFRCLNILLQRLLLFQSRGSRHTGFSTCGLRTLEHRFSSCVQQPRLNCSQECGILLDQGLNPCLLHWQVNSYPLYHQGSL